MKILVTGATGFLGRVFLERLLGDERVERVDVVSRSKTSHPHPKVKMIAVDLSDPSCTNILNPDVDAVVHCAGLYEFEANLTRNYNNNVLPAVHLVGKLKEWNRERKVPIHFASTYAVGYGSRSVIAEQPLVALPSKRVPYVYSKAVAERVVTDSGLCGTVFRLGVLVGDTRGGEIIKIDGPYSVMKIVHALGMTELGRKLPWLPIPGKRYGILPLVPVDVAANVLLEALFRPTDRMSIYGLYNSNSVLTKDFMEAVLAEYMPKATPFFLESLPASLLTLQAAFTRIPAPIFKFALEPVDLGNPGFERDFPNHRVPLFNTYKTAFFEGFRHFLEGRFPSR